MTRLPGVGKKTAERLAYFILDMPRAEAESLAAAIRAVKEKIRLCSVCFNFSEVDSCATCSDTNRDQKSLCVVEEPHDVAAIERSGVHRGVYHVLHGRLSPLAGVTADDLKIAELLSRLKGGSVAEVIVATNPTVDGEATALYLAQCIKPLGIKVTRIAHGLPVGGDLQYTDEATLKKALEGRREI